MVTHDICPYFHTKTKTPFYKSAGLLENVRCLFLLVLQPTQYSKVLKIDHLGVTLNDNYLSKSGKTRL